MIPVIWTDNFRPGTARVIQRVLSKRPSSQPSLPRIAVFDQHIAVDEQQLSRYQRLVGLPTTSTLPPLFLQVYSLPMQLFLLGHDDFSMRVLGLVHLSNQVTQWRAIAAHEDLRVINYLTNLRPHKRGWVFDLCTEALSEGELVWRSTATSLSRAEHNQKASWQGLSLQLHDPVQQPLTLGDDLGRRYAKVSGDYNPIHLWPVTARLFGFNRQIMHGMWSKARCLAAVAEQRDLSRFHCRVDFKKPVSLPASVNINWQGQENGGQFSLTGSQETVHLLGEISDQLPDPVSVQSVHWAQMAQESPDCNGAPAIPFE